MIFVSELKQCVVLIACFAAHCFPLLIQQNVDGSDAFNRSWAEFKVGFNDSRGNYWLGNDLLHQLTTNGRYKLRFDLQARDNRSWFYAEYSSFVVSNEASNYTVQVSGYLGNAGNAFLTHSGHMFTTYDRDNDMWIHELGTNCAVFNGGGFWYSRCGGCNVNTVRGSGNSFRWWSPGNLNLDTSRMWLTC